MKEAGMLVVYLNETPFNKTFKLITKPELYSCLYILACIAKPLINQ